jgi:hypothetical protein
VRLESNVSSFLGDIIADTSVVVLPARLETPDVRSLYRGVDVGPHSAATLLLGSLPNRLPLGMVGTSERVL